MLVAYYGNRLRISKLSVALSFCVLCSSLQRILYMQGTYFYCFFKVFHLFFILIFRKSGFIRRHTIAQKDFERTCADYCISGEKGFASRLNNSLDWWCKAHFFCAYANEVLLRVRRRFLFSLFLCAVSGKPCLTARSINGTSRHTRQANREEWFYPSDRTRSARQTKSYFLAGGLPVSCFRQCSFSF